MHTVIAELCTGCELCVAPCPVDCIIMIPLLASPLPSLTLPPAQDSRTRYDAHNERVERRAALRAETLAAKKRGARPAVKQAP
jgi:electron transport complex protein RnfB